jgi:hypothetical protein
MLRHQTARFKLPERAWYEELPPGVTPEMLERIVALVREQMEAGGDGSGAAEVTATPEPAEEAVLELPLDRDERGYGEF